MHEQFQREPKTMNKVIFTKLVFRQIFFYFFLDHVVELLDVSDIESEDDVLEAVEDIEAVGDTPVAVLPVEPEKEKIVPAQGCILYYYCFLDFYRIYFNNFETSMKKCVFFVRII